MKHHLIGHLTPLQALAWMTRLSADFLAAFFAQTLRLTDKAIEGRRKATIATIFPPLFLQGRYTLREPFDEFITLGQLLFQVTIFLFQFPELLFCCHASNLPRSLSSWQVSSTPEYTQKLDCEQIFEYPSRWRGTSAELTNEQEPKTPDLSVGRPLVTNWGMRFQSPDKHLRSDATSRVYLGKTHPRFLASPPQKAVPFSPMIP